MVPRDGGEVAPVLGDVEVDGGIRADEARDLSRGAPRDLLRRERRAQRLGRGQEHADLLEPALSVHARIVEQRRPSAHPLSAFWTTPPMSRSDAGLCAKYRMPSRRASASVWGR